MVGVVHNLTAISFWGAAHPRQCVGQALVALVNDRAFGALLSHCSSLGLAVFIPCGSPGLDEHSGVRCVPDRHVVAYSG